MLNTKLTSDHAYFHLLRMPLLKLAQGHPKRILEIGCAAGSSLVYFKERGAEWVGGLELSPEVAEIARAHHEIDEVIIGNVEDMDLAYLSGSLDLIIASHVLEHTSDPWAVLRKLRPLLKPGGQLLGALPNVRHLSVLLPLALRGKWRYEERGIMDWTHLRFFSLGTIIELITSTGFEVDQIVPEVIGKKSVLGNTVTLGLFRHFLAYAYNFSAVRTD